MPFSFQAVQTLKITAEDRPSIDVQEGQLVLKATRGDDQIMITAPIGSVLPSVKSASVKTARRARRRVNRTSSTGSRMRYNSGENNKLAKLNEDTVREIRSKASDLGYLKQFSSEYACMKQLAADYGIHITTVYGIVRRNSWKHVL
jgi:hypothetical protein